MWKLHRKLNFPNFFRLAAIYTWTPAFKAEESSQMSLLPAPIKGSSECYASSIHCNEYGHLRTWNICKVKRYSYRNHSQVVVSDYIWGKKSCSVMWRLNTRTCNSNILVVFRLYHIVVFSTYLHRRKSSLYISQENSCVSHRYRQWTTCGAGLSSRLLRSRKFRATGTKMTSLLYTQLIYWLMG